MVMSAAKRDYDLLGPSAQHAVDTGLAAAEWYHSEITRKEMKALMRRSDQPAIRDTAIWLGCMLLFAALGILLWPGLWSLPFWLAYGVLYGSAADSRWHECSHGTAFRTRWMNDWVYQIASFMMMRNPVSWRWSHTRHHTDTLIVGRDPEIVAMRPPAMRRIVLNLFGIVDAWQAMGHMLRNATGRLNSQEATYVPQSEHARLIFVARIWTIIYAATLGLAVWLESLLPLMVIGLPRLFGAWHHVMTGVLQHAALADNVLDHRLNSRTVHMNPVSRFIYWNMNYHIEHHMFPMVPYHQLPALHAAIKHDLPAASTGIWQAYSEVLPVLRHQLRHENWFIKQSLPETASPYRPEFHGQIEPVMATR
jgi:fatty acid desaturase